MSSEPEPELEERSRPATRTLESSHPERICPTCGSVLLERKCKLICPETACGYYLSCSDFY